MNFIVKLSETEDQESDDSIENGFKCQEKGCHKSFKTKYKAKTHYTTVHSLKAKKCIKDTEFRCDERYKSRVRVRSNTKTFEDRHKEERPYVCDYIGCEKSYIHFTNLRAHKLSHNNQFRYRCDWDGCKYATNFTTVLRKHQFKHKGMYKQGLKQGHSQALGCQSFNFNHLLDN